MTNAYQSLTPLIQKKGIITDPEEFHAIVNVVFHDQEAQYYDSLHTEMWQSLPRQYALLADDLKAYFTSRKNLTLLDIGCGTGLATELLLNTIAGQSIANVHLLDTSAVMLGKARYRAKAWHKNIDVTFGDIKAVNGTYDIILVSSVMHHIPDLKAFLTSISALQKPGGLLITMHDPALEALQSHTYKNRYKAYRQHVESGAEKAGRSFISRVINKIKQAFEPQHYINTINQILLKKNIISEPLSETELWSITDIHVEGLPYAANEGISKEMLLKALPGYNLHRYRTYAFFGTLSSNLTGAYKKEEELLSLSADQYGRNFSSIWVKKQD
ncbi:hypothetical protein GCM10023149_32180 [Mucilaginibacter gynuensis]|uniref:Methyltransferase type 12 domain-containing protein n=1 Tax=Mucilaginibacter gynuensis TaxID=1302236 RepID=A0ABP8GPY9_9SPHI